jgi:hypothetical protein
MTNRVKDTADLATAAAIDGNSQHDLAPSHATTLHAAENGSRFQRKQRLRGRLKDALVRAPVSNAMSAGTAAPDEHKIVRARLLGEIKACDYADELARTIAPRLDQATRGDEIKSNLVYANPDGSLFRRRVFVVPGDCPAPEFHL